MDVDLWDPFKRGRYIAGFSTMGDRGLLRGADVERFLLVPLPKAPNGKSVLRAAGMY